MLGHVQFKRQALRRVFGGKLAVDGTGKVREVELALIDRGGFDTVARQRRYAPVTQCADQELAGSSLLSDIRTDLSEFFASRTTYVILGVGLGRARRCDRWTTGSSRVG